MTPQPWKISLSDLDYDEREERAILEVIRSRWLTMGPRTAEFEQRAAEYLGVRHAVAVANCTCALEIAYRIVWHFAPPSANPVVLLPTMTFVATANAVLASGLKPILLDSSSPEKPWLSLEQTRRALEEFRPVAVCAMHYAGVDAGAEVLRQEAERTGAWLVEDAAHAIGGRCFTSPRALGTVGHIGCYSFFSNKNLATGEGGLLVTEDEEVARVARLMRSHGLSAGTSERHWARTTDYDVLCFGHNYRPTEMMAALASVQLAKLETSNARRRQLLLHYRKELKAEAVEFVGPSAASGLMDRSAAHLAVAVFRSREQRDAVRCALHRAGVQTSHHYRPIHCFTYYRAAIERGDVISLPCPHAEAFAERALTLPLHPRLDEDQVSEICSLIRTAMATTRKNPT